MPKPVDYLLLMALSLVSAAGQLTPNAMTRHDHALSAKTEQGDVVITAREMLVGIKHTDGRPRKGAILILFDSASGRYLWELGLTQLSEQTANHTSGYGTTGHAFIAGDRMVDIAWGRPFLMFHESFTKASSLEDAEAKVLAEAAGGLPSKLAGKADDRVLINLGTLLPREFFQACPMCSGPDIIKIEQITHKGNTWEVTLQGPWQEKVALNEKYEVTGTERVK